MGSPAKTTDPWIVRPRAHSAPAFRIFCFPYAGLGASVFRSWPTLFPSNVELVLMQPPGREGRWSVKPFLDLPSLADSATEAILPHLGVPFAFFGHSLGALESFEIARRLRRRGQPQPVHLFASAHRAPQMPNPHPEIHALADGEFIDQICRQYGGIPQAVLDNPDLVELMLPCLRADFNVFEGYKYTDERPFDFSITAFGGTRDRRVSEPEIRGWGAQTTKTFRQQMFEGEHFFLNDQRDSLIASIVKDLAALTAVSVG
jgi:medium-chain acyl-[acyl-carrier-protein] hydrolase